MTTTSKWILDHYVGAKESMSCMYEKKEGLLFLSNHINIIACLLRALTTIFFFFFRTCLINGGVPFLVAHFLSGSRRSGSDRDRMVYLYFGFCPDPFSAKDLSLLDALFFFFTTTPHIPLPPPLTTNHYEQRRRIRLPLQRYAWK